MKNTMKQLLQKFLLAVEKNDKFKVLELNALFEELVPMDLKHFREYDLYRQSCVMAVTNQLGYDSFKIDMKERYKELMIIEGNKLCAYKSLNFKVNDKCEVCQDYDEKCKSYIPLKETDVERVERICRQSFCP